MVPLEFCIIISSMKLSVEEDHCSGCMICVQWCMHRHDGLRRLSRIHVREKEGLVGRIVEVCRQCDDRPCVEACPAEALSVHENTGAVIVDNDLCTGCDECAEACPHNAIRIVDDVAYVCDLCGGAPACVEMCPEKVISICD